MLCARVRSATGRCGKSLQVSSRVHGRYLRRLRDVTVGGVAVLLQVRVRRFRCGNRGWSAVTSAAAASERSAA
ncbi:transposase family protein [Micromonospora chersina]|uniref:transposase family protein n=1 Tax=Micromonospora chersina TaxID=47854 RepID=UPI003716E853